MLGNRHIGGVPDRELVELAHEVQSGSEIALSRLWTECEHLSAHRTYRDPSGMMDASDFKQIAQTWLWFAAMTYAPEDGVTFRAHARQQMRNGLLSEVNKVRVESRGGGRRNDSWEDLQERSIPYNTTRMVSPFSESYANFIMKGYIKKVFSLLKEEPSRSAMKAYTFLFLRLQNPDWDMDRIAQEMGVGVEAVRSYSIKTRDVFLEVMKDKCWGFDTGTYMWMSSEGGPGYGNF